jgi:predicted phosphoribosyltransferase
MGAIASGGVLVLEPTVIEDLAIPPDVVADVAAREEQERLRREREYRDERPEPDVRGRTIILVDDGLATGSTMRAAVAALRKLQPARIVVAVPVAAPATCEDLVPEVDEIVCARTPEPFHSVGSWYLEFSQTTDQEVRDLLARAEHQTAHRR